MRLVFLELKACEEAGIKDRCCILADAAADAVDEVTVDDRSSRNETVCRGAWADKLVYREGLSGFNNYALGEFGDALNIDVAALSGGVAGGERGDEFGDTQALGPLGSPWT